MKVGHLLALILDQQRPLQQTHQDGRERGGCQVQLWQIPPLHLRSDLLTRNDLPDIVAAVLDALPNATATTPAHSSRLATQPATNP